MWHDLIFSPLFLQIAFLASWLDRLFGYPNVLLRCIGHPVQWMGVQIAWLDRWLNSRDTGVGCCWRGVFALSFMCCSTVFLAFLCVLPLRWMPGGWVIESVLASFFLARKSLGDHVSAVVAGLSDSVSSGRVAVGRIVGRDVARLDETGISAAAIESLAENSSDGVIAPLFFLLFAGLPGIALYKMVNTADSMIGYMTPRYRAFGWAAARLDDVLNYLPARLTGLLFVGMAALSSQMSGRKSMLSMWSDGRTHASPNAGYPEAAMAGALGIRLGGARHYGGMFVDAPSMGEGPPPSAMDIVRALSFQDDALDLLLLLLAAGVIACLLYTHV